MNKLLTWLKEFQNNWLTENLPNNNHVVELIQNKLQEFEKLIIEVTEDEEEYNRAKLLNDDSSSNSETEQLPIASTSAHQVLTESSLPTPPDVHLPLDVETEEEQSRRILLADSDNSDKEIFLEPDDETPSQPSIIIKRISQTDAELYMPLAWKNIRSNSTSGTSDASVNHENRHRKYQNKSNVPDDSNDSEVRTRSKFNAASNIDNDDQDSESSLTNETSQSSYMSSTSDEDFTIKVRTRKSLSTKPKTSSKNSRKIATRSHKKHDVVINYNLSTTPLNESSSDEPIEQDPTVINSSTVAEDTVPTDDDRVLKDVIENNDNESVFESLDITQGKPMETDRNKNRSNDEIDSLPTEDSSPENLPIEVPSYAHLLNHSKLSSDSDNSTKKNSSVNRKKQSNGTKRTVHLSSNSNSPIITKKSKLPTKYRAAIASLSSSSDDTENNSISAPNEVSSKRSSSVSSRVRIQRSSSSSEPSTISNEISTKTSKKRRRISDSSSEQIKSKTKSKKTSTPRRESDYDSSTETENPNSKSTDDESTNDDEVSPSKRKHGRKNIRKIIDDQELHDQTKEAIEAERERRKRIAEKQKIYNDTLLEQSSYMSVNDNDELNSSNRRLILELDKTTNEPLIEVSSKLVEQLKPHQHDGIRFLWNNVFESIDAIKNKKQNGNGCILAHCMGLGKTLQVISFIHTAFTYSEITKVKTCLVLCPINAALNWSNEFDHWLKDVEPPIDHFQLTTVRPNLRVSHLDYWYENGGVMIMGYEIYRRLANGIGIKNKKAKTDAFKYLVDPGPDIIVADEGHILKNAQTALAKCLSKIKTSRRIVLTGTPLQNNLIEYYCMVSFIKPSLLGSQSEYINRFVNPIQNGQHRDSNEEDVRLMKRRACVLHELLTGFVDRKDYSLLKEYLPPKFEYIINIRLSDLQSKLYEMYLKQQVDQGQRISALKKDFKSAKLFADYQYLQKIWTHPFLLYPHFIDRWKKRLNKDDDSLIDDNELEDLFIDDEENLGASKKKKKRPMQNQPADENAFSGFLIENVKDEMSESKPIISTRRKSLASASSTTTIDSESVEENLTEEIDSNNDDDIEIIKTYPTRSRTATNDKSKNLFDQENDDNTIQQSDDNEPWLDEMREQFWFSYLDSLPKESKFDIELSGKFLLLKFIIDKCAEIGDKILLFTRSLYALDYIESFLKHLHTENEKEYLKQCESRRELQQILSSNGNDHDDYILPPVEWIRDRDYFRMDGQTEVLSRKRYAKAFNNPSNLRARLFLISTLAGGIGINLTGSNRVIVFDASWNPSHDTQAIFRSYRFGQKKPVYIYRFLAHGTMEEKIYQRQVVKQSISQRVVDDHQLDRHFTQNDIKELYKFKAEPLPEPRSTLSNDSAENFNYQIPKDNLLFDLLYQHGRWVHSYHSHDSLLENKIDEGLTAEERRRALEEYENLKHRPDPRQLAFQRLQQQQQLNALIAQQQQIAASLVPGNAQTTYADMIRNLQNGHGQNLDFARLLQHIYETESARGLARNLSASNNNRGSQPRPIAPRQPWPTTTNSATTNSNDVILVESDEEMNSI